MSYYYSSVLSVLGTNYQNHFLTYQCIARTFGEEFNLLVCGSAFATAKYNPPTFLTRIHMYSNPFQRTQYHFRLQYMYTYETTMLKELTSYVAV